MAASNEGASCMAQSVSGMGACIVRHIAGCDCCCSMGGRLNGGAAENRAVWTTG